MEMCSLQMHAWKTIATHSVSAPPFIFSRTWHVTTVTDTCNFRNIKHWSSANDRTQSLVTRLGASKGLESYQC
eukprot:990941-Amphidinium_carterae.1